MDRYSQIIILYLENSHKIFLGMRGYDIPSLLFLFNPPTLIFGKRSWKTTDNKKIVFSYNLSFYWHSKSASEGFGFHSFLMCINTNFKSTLVAWSSSQTELELMPPAEYTCRLCNQEINYCNIKMLMILHI